MILVARRSSGFSIPHQFPVKIERESFSRKEAKKQEKKNSSAFSIYSLLKVYGH